MPDWIPASSYILPIRVGQSIGGEISTPLVQPGCSSDLHDVTFGVVSNGPW